MTVYTKSEQTTVLWPEPMEQTWQMLGRGAGTTLAPKLPHLCLADLLFIGAVANIPEHRRPWGSITWLADVFSISRVSVYSLGERIRDRLQGPDQPVERLEGLPVFLEDQADVAAANRLARTVLAATFPGNVSIRATQEILKEALGQSRSVGWISQLRLEAGKRAGQVLSKIDTSPLGPLIVVRDETFFQEYPILMVIDPISTTILFAQACEDRKADTWGVALLLAQERGATIAGLVEDMARSYPKSQKLVDMGEIAVQKDTWHLQRDGGKVRLYLEKAAYRAMHKVFELEKQLTKAWDDTLFEEKYLQAVAVEERLIAHHDSFAQWLEHLHDAFELVDWRSGDIRDPDTAAWFMEEILTALDEINHPRVKKFVTTLRNHQKELLTFLDWTAAALTSYRTTLAQHFSDPQDQQHFERSVARHWRLQQALINGHRQWQNEAHQAQIDWLALLADDPTREHLAAQLLRILDSSGRTSSLIECINGVLKSFLNNRQCFKNVHTLQAYLDLFVLWHNMQVYSRGKRRGQSPYQIADIDPGSTDWLELLGFPAC